MVRTYQLASLGGVQRNEQRRTRADSYILVLSHLTARTRMFVC
jgi:hypothetical protein